MKAKICNTIAKILEVVSVEEIEKIVEIPPEEYMGDYAVPCFSFAKIMRKNPAAIAADLKVSLAKEQKILGIKKSRHKTALLILF